MRSMKPDKVWLSTSGNVHRRQAHWIELQLIGRRDGLAVQGDLYTVRGLIGCCSLLPRADCRVLTASRTKAPKYVTISISFLAHT